MRTTGVITTAATRYTRDERSTGFIVEDSVGFAIVDIEPKRAADKIADKYPIMAGLFCTIDTFISVLLNIQ